MFKWWCDEFSKECDYIWFFDDDLFLVWFVVLIILVMLVKIGVFSDELLDVIGWSLGGLLIEYDDEERKFKVREVIE